MTRQDVAESTGPIEACVVFAAVKDAARRRRRWPAALLDSHSARRTSNRQAGTEKRRSGDSVLKVQQ